MWSPRRSSRAPPWSFVAFSFSSSSSRRDLRPEGTVAKRRRESGIRSTPGRRCPESPARLSFAAPLESEIDPAARADDPYASSDPSEDEAPLSAVAPCPTSRLPQSPPAAAIALSAHHDGVAARSDRPSTARFLVFERGLRARPFVPERQSQTLHGRSVFTRPERSPTRARGRESPK